MSMEWRDTVNVPKVEQLRQEQHKVLVLAKEQHELQGEPVLVERVG